MATVVPAKIETSQKLPEQSNYNGLPRGDHLEPGRRSGDMAQLVPHRVWWLSIGKDIVAAEVPRKSQELQPYTRLPTPRIQCQEEESPQHLAVKTSGDSGCPGEKNCSWKPRRRPKGLTHRIACLPLLTSGSDRGATAQEAPETHKERLSCADSGQGLEGQPPLSFVELSSWAACKQALSCLFESFPCTANSESALAQ